VTHNFQTGEKNKIEPFTKYEKDHWEDQDVGGWIILKWILDTMEWYEGIDVAENNPYGEFLYTR
jgi:hypothetical protein